MRKCICYISLLFISLQVMGQDAQFSQYFATKTIVNPAYAGITPEMEFSANYKRSGNKEADSFFELAQATFIYPLRKTTSKTTQLGGVGATFFRESRGFQGIYTSQKFLLTGAYGIRLSQFVKNKLVFGIQSGLVQNSLSDDALNWGSQFNRYWGYDDTLDGETISNGNIYYPVVNFGVMYTVYDNESIYLRDKSLILGLSADNLNQPKTGDGRKNIQYRGFGSFKFRTLSRMFVQPSLLVLTEGTNFQLNTGCYLSTMVNSVRSRTAVIIQTGAWYRFGDSIIVLGGFEINEFRVGASFDLNSKSLTENEVFLNTNPAYEVSLTYIFTKQKNVRKVSNPIF